MKAAPAGKEIIENNIMVGGSLSDFTASAPYKASAAQYSMPAIWHRWL